MKSAPETISLSPRAAAVALGISREHVRLALKLGTIPGFKLGNRTLILRDDLVAWVRRLPRSNAHEQS
jgi:excisionase family DNA binding protein